MITDKIGLILESLSKPPIPPKIREFIDERNALDKIDEDYECIVCLKIIIDPERCSECHKMFCRECIIRTKTVKD